MDFSALYVGLYLVLRGIFTGYISRLQVTKLQQEEVFQETKKRN